MDRIGQASRPTEKRMMDLRQKDAEEVEYYVPSDDESYCIDTQNFIDKPALVFGIAYTFIQQRPVLPGDLAPNFEGAALQGGDIKHISLNQFKVKIYI